MPSLRSFFEASRVAVIGATDRQGSIGRAILENLLADFDGEVVPVNPTRSAVLDLACVPSISDVDAPVDLAIVVVPADAVNPVLEELAAADVRNVVIISAGFGETDEEGRARQRTLVELASEHDLNVVGPNSLGIINTENGLNATFAKQNALPGSISFMSQSGAFIAAVLDWATERDIGFRHVVSLGNEAVLDEEDFVRAWGEDPGTSVILGYAEDIKRGQAFIDTARRVTAQTPVVMLKSGRSTEGARAAASHTGSLAGSDRAYDAAFHQGGVIRADTVQDLFDFGRALAGQPAPPTEDIAIVTNAGGPGVLAADAIGQSNLSLAQFSAQTESALGEVLPDAATVANPLDIIGDASLERFEDTLRIVLDDADVGGLLVLACPTALFDHGDLADVVGSVTADEARPVLACLMGGEAATAATRHLDAFDIPNYFDPSRAVRSMEVLSRQRSIRSREPDKPREFTTDDDRVEAILGAAADAGRTQLGPEAIDILDAYGIPTAASEMATSPSEAARIAESFGEPVVLKLVSPDIVHKSDVGGVRVGVEPSAVEHTYRELQKVAENYDPSAEVLGVQVQELFDLEGGVETIVGTNRDPQFGPVVMFGLGGVFVEVLQDVCFRVAPIGPRSAREMTEELDAAPMLRGARGRQPADLDAVVEVLQRVSQLATTHPTITEMDINPLVAGPAGVTAIDFRATIDPSMDN